MTQTAPSWTDARHRLLGTLVRLDPVLGELYRRAVDLIAEDELTPASFMLVCHCVRELVNGLPDVLEDVDAVPARSNSSGASDALAKVWREHEDFLEGIEVSGLGSQPEASDTSPRTEMAILVQFRDAARGVVVASETGTRNARLRVSALVLGRLENNTDPSVELFRKALRFFNKRVHFSRKAAKLPDHSEIMYSFAVIERAVAARLGSFFEVADEILDIVNIANQRSSGDGK